MEGAIAILWLIVPEILDWIFIVLGILSTLIFILIVYRVFVRPALLVKAEQDAPPPEEGFKYEILIDDLERTQIITIGQQDGLINTRLNGIKEDHLILKFVKDRGLEEYEITIQPGGPLQYRRPHARKLDLIKTSDVFASRELIGHPALFRVVANLKDHRALQYVEFELSVAYVINNLGEEKMLFTLELTRIYPSLDVDSRDKKGLFSFGRLKRESEEE